MCRFSLRVFTPRARLCNYHEHIRCDVPHYSLTLSCALSYTRFYTHTLSLSLSLSLSYTPQLSPPLLSLGNRFFDGGAVQFWTQALGVVAAENTFTRTAGLQSWGLQVCVFKGLLNSYTVLNGMVIPSSVNCTGSSCTKHSSSYVLSIHQSTNTVKISKGGNEQGVGHQLPRIVRG